MITLQNIHKQYGPKVLFDDVTFHLKPGECVGLVGENGMGKTTLMRIALHREEVDSGKVVVRKGARVAMLDQELTPGTGTVLERVALGDPYFSKVKQDMERLENDHSLHQRAPEEWSKKYGHLQHEFERLGGYERESRAKSILSGLGFKTGQWDEPLEKFSGGWRMRAELGRLLLQNPEVLLLDEPTNHLDLHSVVWLESFLKSFEGSLLLISHDRRFLNGLVGRIVELDRGTLTSTTGNFDNYEKQKAERLALLEAQAVNQGKKIAQVEKFIERFRAKNTKATQVQSRIKMLNKMERVQTITQSKTVHFRFPQPPRTGRIVAELKHLDKSYGDVQVYQDFSIALDRGVKVALVGPNGAGKSTLLKLMTGILEFEKGELKLGANVTRAYYAQHHSETLNPDQTVLQSLEEVAGHLPRTQKQSILGAFLFSGNDVNKKVSVLSGGERSRLALARMMAVPASFLLLDEPTNHLDMRSCEVLAAALADYEGTLVTISHDRYFLDGIINRVWEVEDGQVKEYFGNYSNYEWAKAQEAETEKIKQQPAKEKSGETRKEQKRREAEARNKKHRQLKPLENRLKKVEARLEQVMQDKQNIEAKLADSALYQEDQKTDLLDALARQKDLAYEENSLLTEWDSIKTQIEDFAKPPAGM